MPLLSAVLVLLLLPAGSHAEGAPSLEDDATCACLPIAEFHAEIPSDPEEARLRQARNQRFSLSQGGPFLENSGGMSISLHPPLRSLDDLVSESDAIVEGTVSSAAAFLSENRWVVYAEYGFRVERVVRDRHLPKTQPLLEGETASVLREGGAVRLPNGRIVEQSWNSQGLPRTSLRYLLFLRREPAIAAFTMLAGYLIDDSRVCSLDGGGWVPRYTGRALDSLRREIVALAAARLDARGDAPADRADEAGWLPVAASQPVAPSDPNDATVRQARSRRFSRSLGGRITTDDDGNQAVFFPPRFTKDKELVYAAGLIVEGTVGRPASFMAENQEVVYSEFPFHIERVLKQRRSAGPELREGDTITILREGGAMRLPSGKVIQQIWEARHLPRVGVKYVFFLASEPGIEGFTVITGYRAGRPVARSVDGYLAFPNLKGTSIQALRQHVADLAEEVRPFEE